jgi:DNA-binding transcriptional LysR family regulator
MADLTLTGLRVLREVAARGSFTAAADALGYTQSAISRQVAGLEAAAGAPLFTRASRGVRLTEAGRLLLERTGGVIDQVEAARQAVAGLGQRAAGRLRVGAFDTALADLLPRAIVSFRDEHAGVEVSLREGSTPAQLRRLVSGATDLAVVSALPGETIEDRRVALEPLLDEPLLLAVARDHPLAGRRSVELAALGQERWVSASTVPTETFLGVWPSLDWEPRVEFVARGWTAKLGLVAAGLGATVVPGIAASAIRDDVALVRVRSEEPTLRKVFLAARAGAEPPAYSREFADTLHAVAGELGREIQRRIGG